MTREDAVEYRDNLVRAVQAVSGGELTPAQRDGVMFALRSEMRARLLWSELVGLRPRLNPDQLLRFSLELSRAERDASRTVQALLAGRPVDPGGAIDAPGAPQTAPAARNGPGPVQRARDAAGASLGGPGGFVDAEPGQSDFAEK
jgi:hypothetical protein